MKSKLMVLLSVILAVLLSSCAAPGGESYSHTTYQGRLENGIWESAPVSFSQDGKTYENEIIQISIDNGNVTFKLKNSNVVSRSTSYGEDNSLTDPYNPDRTLVVGANYVNDVLSSFEISGGFFLRGFGSSFVITKVSSTPEKWEENYKPVADLSDFEFEDNESGVTLIKYNGDDSYLIVPSHDESGKPVTVIASEAFGSYFSSIGAPYEIILPDTLTTIEDNAFCSIAIENITIPDSVTNLGNAFYNCSNLKTLKIGAGVTELTFEFFSDIELENLIISEKNENIKTVDGLILSKDGKNLKFFVKSLLPSSLVIPSSVRTVEQEFLLNSSNINIPITIDGADITFESSLTASASEVNIIDSTVTINGTSFYAKKLIVEDSKVFGNHINSQSSISIHNSTIKAPGGFSVLGGIDINGSEINGNIEARSENEYDGLSPYSINIVDSTATSFRLLDPKINLTSMDLSGLTVGTLDISVGGKDNPLSFEEIKLPKDVTKAFNLEIINGTKINKIYLPHYNNIFESSDMNPSLWSFYIDMDSEVKFVEIAEGYHRDPVNNGNLEVYHGVPYYSEDRYSAREAIFFVPEKGSVEPDAGEIPVYWGLDKEWEYDENGYPVKIGSGNIDPDEPQSGSLLGTWTGDNAIVAAMGSYTFEFNADGTVVYTENTYGTTTAYNGTWSLSGTSLTMDFSGSSYQNPSLISGTGKIDIASDGSSFTFDGNDNFGNNENWGTFYRK